MAIKPPSDLVLDVAAAADPAKVKAATERLDKARAESAGEAFQAALATASAMTAAPASEPAAAPKSAAEKTTAADTTARNAALLRKDTPAKAMEKFEAFFLQAALQDMLPKNAPSVFGSGLAGDVWKSMLAEQLAAEMAKSAKFGIAERLAGKHFAAAPGRGAPTSSAVSPQTGDLPGAAKNLPFLQDHAIPALPGKSALSTGPLAPKRS